MAITPEEKQELKQELLNDLKNDSQSVEDLERVSTLDGIYTLPAMRGTEVVAAPVDLLSKPARDAATEVLGIKDSLTAAAEAANTAADTAKQKAKEAGDATDKAVQASGEATEAASKANNAAESVTSKQIGSIQSSRDEDNHVTITLVNPEGSKLAESTFEVGSGDGGNTINVTKEYPLESGYYALGTAVEEKRRAKGKCITFEQSQGKWITKQFVGTSMSLWSQETAWADFGSGGLVKSISVNGKPQQMDEGGKVNLTIDEVEVDESLDAESTNPVQNKAIAAKLSEIEKGTVSGMNAELSDDGSSVRLSLTNKSGAEIASADIPAGSGGSGDSSATKIVLQAKTDVKTVKEGGAVELSYTYDHQTAGGESTGQKAKITIEVKRGTTTTYTATLKDVSKGTYSIDLSKYILVGTMDIYIVAETTDPNTGKAQKRQAYCAVRCVSLKLTSSYNLANTIKNGGYATSEAASIPYSVSGTGTKNVVLYIDGTQNSTHVVTRSGTTNGSFDVSMALLSTGRHTVQMVAEMETEDLTLRSESIYIDLLKRGTDSPFFGVKLINQDGRILNTGEHLKPTAEVTQYDKFSFDYIAYDPLTTPATVSVYKEGAPSGSITAPRSMMVYSNRPSTYGEKTLRFQIGTYAYDMLVNVHKSKIDIEEASFGLAHKFTAAGRSNGEKNPAQWTSNGIQTTFEGFDWTSNGWTGESLKLSNGAKAVIDYKPFAKDLKATGATIEFTMKVSNIADREAPVISCLNGGKGLYITATEASFLTGQTVSYTNEEDEQVTREIKLATNFVEDKWVKIALVISTTANRRLMELYVNGNRTGADIYDSSFSFVQDSPQPITITSDDADVEIKSIRIYDRRLSDDEELENDIVDSENSDEMMTRYDENNILGDNGKVSLDKLRNKGKAVLRIVREGKLVDVFETNNKKTDFLADVYFYSPFGKEYDFVLHNGYIRIQGTSSTKYPSKNIRIYLNKGTEGLSLEVGGVEQQERKYALRPGSIPMPIICLKSDYSDSSMSLNTGGAKLFNNMLKQLKFLTPPQQYQYEQGGNNLNAVTVRTAIDGFPVDVFAADTEDGENDYYGQYNFNNDKSKSVALFGMEDFDDFHPECPIALEALNNTEKLCLLQSTSDEQVQTDFDNAFETNVPDDVKWAGLDETQRNKTLRLFRWIRDCVPSGADANNLSTFKSDKFKREFTLYFNKDITLAFYLWTDYNASVDQRAKNIIWRTWNGDVWMPTYYDGDTARGKRNDSFLKYLYTLTRDTYDAEAAKYAFEGRDSWIWNLILANMQDELREVAQKMRNVLTVESVLNMFSKEQSGNWSDRAFNKSGEFKYIIPATETVYGKKWPFIYALQGSNKEYGEYFVRNRFALLDAKYGTSSFTADNIDLYLSRKNSDAPDTLKLTPAEVYAFGYGTNNKTNIANTGIVEKGKEALLQIAEAYTINDPLRFYGASRIKVLNMTGAADHLKNAFDLSKCTVLQELNLASSSAGSSGWWLVIDACKQLRKISLRNQAQAKTGGSTSSTLDFSAHSKLTEADLRGTGVQSVVIAKGAPITKLSLPASLTMLRLEHLDRLTPEGLTFEGTSAIESFVFDSCSKLSWETILQQLTAVKRIRITGINKTDDGSWLESFKKYGGIDAIGNTTDTCALVGTVQLTSYMEDEKYTELKAHFPELNILQPEYSMIEFDDSVADDANVSNLDNKTGYKYGTPYEMSGHIKAILKKRHRVLAKVTKKPTTRNINIANTDTICNNLDGEMTYYPLHDRNSNFYADNENVNLCSPAKLDATEGDWMMYEPFFWSKGVNDHLNNKHYSVYSSNGKDNKPRTPEATVITLEDIKQAKRFTEKKKIQTNRDTIQQSLTDDNSYSVCAVVVEGYKRVRFPSVPGTELIGASFIDEGGNVISSIIVPTLNNRFEAGMYIISDIPETAKMLYFTILNTAEFDMVVLSNSDKIEDMEPLWIANDEHLCAVVGSTDIGGKLRAAITGSSTTANINWRDFHYNSVTRGMQQIDALMHSRIANLFYARYGRRNSQDQCGGGQHSQTRITGGTAEYGMADTIGYDDAHVIDSSIRNSVIEGVVHEFAWYKHEDIYGAASVTQVNNICCLGYEDIYGHKYEMMDCVDLPNTSDKYAKWRIWMPDGTVRYVKSHGNNDKWTTAVAHGTYMDVVPVGTVNGAGNTHYCDKYYFNGGQSRVVYRGYNYAFSAAGVSFACAYSDASAAFTFVGSRLAFRGKLVKAQSVEAYKEIVEKA